MDDSYSPKFEEKQGKCFSPQATKPRVTLNGTRAVITPSCEAESIAHLRALLLLLVKHSLVVEPELILPTPYIAPHTQKHRNTSRMELGFTSSVIALAQACSKICSILSADLSSYARASDKFKSLSLEIESMRKSMSVVYKQLELSNPQGSLDYKACLERILSKCGDIQQKFDHGLQRRPEAILRIVARSKASSGIFLKHMGSLGKDLQLLTTNMLSSLVCLQTLVSVKCQLSPGFDPKSLSDGSSESLESQSHPPNSEFRRSTFERPAHTFGTVLSLHNSKIITLMSPILFALSASAVAPDCKGHRNQVDLQAMNYDYDSFIRSLYYTQSRLQSVRPPLQSITFPFSANRKTLTAPKSALSSPRLPHHHAS